jgi:general secretion pathway protein L
MAVASLKRGDAIVWLPARTEAERGLGTEAHLLALRAPPAGTGSFERVSIDALQGTNRVRLIFDARDVTLLAPQVPALTGSRLQQALPNVIEDALLQDVAACAVIAGPALDDGRRVVAVIDRDWLETVIGQFEQRGMRVQSAWPAQLALPPAADAADWSLACTRDALVLRTGPYAGLGWRAPEDPSLRTEALTDLLSAALVTLPRPAGLSVWVEDAHWDEPLQSAAHSQGLELHPMGALQTAGSVAPDLLGGRAGASRRMMASFDARAWRVPAALAGACGVAALIGLNLHWAQLARERDALRGAMDASFRAAFPGTQVVVDPVLQMNRQVTALRARSGQSGPADFLPLLGRLGEALGPSGTDAIASMEYREGRLKVRFRPDRVDGRAARDQLRQACTRAGLKLDFDNEREPTATVGLQG